MGIVRLMCFVAPAIIGAAMLYAYYDTQQANYQKACLFKVNELYGKIDSSPSLTSQRHSDLVSQCVDSLNP